MKLIEVTIGTGPDADRRQSSVTFRGEAPDNDMVRLWFDLAPDDQATLAASRDTVTAKARALLADCLSQLDG